MRRKTPTHSLTHSLKKSAAKAAVENPHQSGISNADDGLVQVIVDTL
jgi:hypothetical protein